MFTLSKRDWFVSTAIACTVNLAFPQIAFGQEAAEAAPETTLQQPAADLPENFVSDGSRVIVNELGIAITPPAMWEVKTKASNLSLIMQEQRRDRPDYKNTSYQRNITVAAIHKSSPIDEKRAEELKNEMKEAFGKDTMITEFEVLEHRFFNYRGENDGLLVYSSLKIDNYPMMQMHVLVSGAQNQFLMTYTDLAERFTAQGNNNFEQAWTTMTGLEVTGATPLRRDEYIRYAVIAGGCLFLFGTLMTIRRKRNRYDYMSDLDELDLESDGGPSHSVIATLNRGWRLDGKESSEPDLDLDLHGDLPKTKVTTYVSNY